MQNPFTAIDDINEHLKTTNAKEFYVVMIAPSGNKVFSQSNGWVNVDASFTDWPFDSLIVPRAALYEKYYEIVRDTRIDPFFPDATEVTVYPKKEDAEA